MFLGLQFKQIVNFTSLNNESMGLSNHLAFITFLFEVIEFKHQVPLFIDYVSSSLKFIVFV